LMGMSDREEPPGFGTDVSWGFLEKVFEQAARRAPALGGAGIKTAWAGLYETTPDHQAILGPVPELEGFWCAAGFSGHGFMQAPAAALLLTQMLLEKKSEIDISPFRVHSLRERIAREREERDLAACILSLPIGRQDHLPRLGRGDPSGRWGSARQRLKIIAKIIKITPPRMNRAAHPIWMIV